MQVAHSRHAFGAGRWHVHRAQRLATLYQNSPALFQKILAPPGVCPAICRSCQRVNRLRVFAALPLAHVRPWRLSGQRIRSGRRSTLLHARRAADGSPVSAGLLAGCSTPVSVCFLAVACQIPAEFCIPVEIHGEGASHNRRNWLVLSWFSSAAPSGYDSLLLCTAYFPQRRHTPSCHSCCAVIWALVLVGPVCKV